MKMKSFNKKKDDFVAKQIIDNFSFEDGNILTENGKDNSQDTKPNLMEDIQDIIDLSILKNNINSNKMLIKNYEKKCKICQKKCKMIKTNEFLLCYKCLELELYKQVKKIYFRFINNFNKKEIFRKKFKNIFEFLKETTITICDKKINIDTILKGGK